MLEVVPGPDANAASAAETESRGQDIVYVVDDDSSVRRSMVYFLRAAGFDPRPFTGGASFLSEIDGLKSGCVLLDVRMPDIDGIEVLEKMAPHLSNLAVIVLTAHGAVPTAVRAMKLGAVDFLEKPFEDQSLLDSLARAFGDLRCGQEQAGHQARADRLLKRLTTREHEVLLGLLAGQSNKIIAYDLRLSVRTVEMHRASLMERLEARSLQEIVRIGLLAGLATA